MDNYVLEMYKFKLIASQTCPLENKKHSFSEYIDTQTNFKLKLRYIHGTEHGKIACTL